MFSGFYHFCLFISTFVSRIAEESYRFACSLGNKCKRRIDHIFVQSVGTESLYKACCICISQDIMITFLEFAAIDAKYPQENLLF